VATALMSGAPKVASALGDYIGGRFLLPPEGGGDGLIERVSPRDYEDVVLRAPFRHAAVEEAVASARAAARPWARTGLDARKALLVALRGALAARGDELAAAITREVGKPGWEARAEVQAALAKVDITLSDGLALVAPREMAEGQRYAFKPHGVAGVLGPFNFPLHLVHGHVVPLLVTGNTVVIKPSELTPLVGQLYAQCFEAAGFPAGVFNLVQGDASQGALLAAHPELDVVALTGSFAAGQSIKRATLEQPHKLLALELGGRNPAIVLADADLDKAVHDVLWGAFVTAGQRCSGTAVALVARELFDAFLSRARAQLAQIAVGDPLRPDVFMGPLISQAAQGRYLAQLAQAQVEGAEAVVAPRALELSPRGAYVSPSLHLVRAPRGAAYEREELFGPDLALEPVDDLDHAIARANHSPYGLSASVFTRDEHAFEHALGELRYGCVNLNAPTCGASSRLPFGGTKQSGNHRPAALFSTFYSSYPVASIRGPASLDPRTLSPGWGRSA
jgi:succinylglutamic semialdehyde dehydrogenase